MFRSRNRIVLLGMGRTIVKLRTKRHIGHRTYVNRSAQNGRNNSLLPHSTCLPGGETSIWPRNAGIFGGIPFITRLEREVVFPGGWQRVPFSPAAQQMVELFVELLVGGGRPEEFLVTFKGTLGVELSGRCGDQRQRADCA